MPLERLDSLLHYLLRHARPRLGDDVTDGTLLERFIREREEAAFTALVDRHGPMVFGVCRRVLGHHQDAEDVFQAAFLILARRAASLRRAESVAAWLHTVAYRLALHSHAARRPTEDGRNLDMLPAEPDSAAVWRDLRPVLDEELQRLPEKYRVPVVLCYLEGRTHTEAAQQLGWPKGTVAGRLARAREVLRMRLTRRGITLSAGLLGTVLAEQAATAVPAALVRLTIRGAVAFAAASTAGVSAKVLALAEGGIQAMMMAKLKLGVVLGLILTFAVGGAGVWAHQALRGIPPADLAATAEESGPGEDAPHVLVDQSGDALPPGAVARLGTNRWRAGKGIRQFVFSRDGRIMASREEGPYLRLWDVATGRPLRVIQTPQLQNKVIAFSADGKQLSAMGASRTKMFTWDVGTGQLIRTVVIDPDSFDLHCVSPDGKLAAGEVGQRQGNPRPFVFDVSTGKEVVTLEMPREPSRYVHPRAFSPDGKWLAGWVTFWPDAAKTKYPETIYIWDLTTGKKLRSLGDTTGWHGIPMAISNDGRCLATATGQGVIHIWDVATGKEIRHWNITDKKFVFLPEATGMVRQLLFTRDDRFLLVVQRDQGRAPIQVRDVATGRLVRAFGDEETGPTVHLWPGERLVATSMFYGTTLKFWDITTGQPLKMPHGHTDQVRSARFLDDHRTVVSVGEEGSQHIWDALSGKELGHLSGSPTTPFDGAVITGAGKTMLVTSGQKASLRELRSGKVLQDVPIPGEGRSVAGGSMRRVSIALSPDDRAFAVAFRIGGNPNVKAPLVHDLVVRDASSGKLRWERRGLAFTPGPLAFSPDGAVLALADYYETSTIRLFQAGTGEFLYELGGDRQQNIRGNLAFSPDGRLLVTGFRNKPTDNYDPSCSLHVWEVASGMERLVLDGHKALMSAVSVSPDGRTLASGDYEAVIRVWDVASGRELACFQGHTGPIQCLAFSADGVRLVSGSDDTTLLVWDLKNLIHAAARPITPLSAKDLDNAWTTLAGPDAKAAHRAIYTLASAPEVAVPLLRQRLKPVGTIKPEQLARWVKALDDARFEVRDQANRELEAAGQAAEEVLTKALAERPSAELRQRVEGLLKKLRGPVTQPKLLQAIRAVEVLEHIGTPESREILKTMADGVPEARLTREAKGALRYLAESAAK